MTYPLEAAARLAGVTERHIRYLIRVGEISARRVGSRIVLSFAEIARLKQLGSARRRREACAAQLPLALVFPSAEVVPMPPAAERSSRASTASKIDELRERAGALEDSDPEAALSLLADVAQATGDPSDWANLLAASHEHGFAEESVLLAGELRSRFPDSAAVQFNCGVALHGGKQYADAAAAYEAALALDADYMDAHRYLHECYEALGQQQLAIRHGSAWLRSSRS